MMNFVPPTLEEERAWRLQFLAQRGIDIEREPASLADTLTLVSQRLWVRAEDDDFLTRASSHVRPFLKDQN